MDMNEMKMDPNMNMGNDTNSTMDMDMMKMYFHFGMNDLILFEGWKPSTFWAQFGSCVVIFIAAVLYEALKCYREKLHRKWSKVYTSAEDMPSCQRTTLGSSSQNLSKLMFNVPHFVQTALQIVQVTLSYLLMLVFMTYNVSLCVALILGAGLGYFVFGWRNNSTGEHCY